MSNKALINIQGLEVYQSDIDFLCDEYISSLHDPSMIYKAPCFKGMLLYIYQTKLKYIIETDKHNRNTILHNFDLLNDIFYRVYLPLTYRYNITPSVLEFACFIDIPHETLSDLKAGVYRPDRAKVNPRTNHTVKKWYQMCESGLVSKAVENNGIGAIFLLKSKYGYQEAAQQVELTTTQAQATPEQIAERYRDAKRPQLESV